MLPKPLDTFHSDRSVLSQNFRVLIHHVPIATSVYVGKKQKEKKYEDPTIKTPFSAIFTH